MEIVKRQEAQTKQLVRYFTGIPCKHGHVSERYTKNRCCIKCNEIDVKQSSIKHKEKRRAYRKKHYRKHREVYIQKAIRYNKAHPEQIKKDTITRTIAYKNATPVWYEKELIHQLYLKRDELSKLWGIKLHVDHVIPLRGKNVCGLHCWDNLQLLEASINQNKGNSF